MAGSGSGQALGVQPADPRGPGDQLRLAQRRPAATAEGSVRHHARRRHADDPRHGASAGGTLAQPAQLRPRFDPALGVWSRATRSCSRGELPPCRGHAHRDSPRCWRRRGDRPVRDGLLRRLHGPVRPGELHGQGIYDVDAFEAATAGLSPRTRSSATTWSRELRALRPGQRHRAIRRLPGPLPRLCPPRSPLGPRRDGQCLLPGSARGCQTSEGGRRKPLRSWSVGSCSTTSDAVSSPPALVVLLILGWTALPARPGSGRRRRWRCPPWRSCR